MLLFASFQGQSVTQIALMFQASATHVAELIHAFNAEGFACLGPRRGGGRPRRIDLTQRAEIVKVALARPVDLGQPFTSWSLTKLSAHLLRRRVVPSISRSQLWRILHDQGIRFAHPKTWKTSPDPEFEAKKNRVLDIELVYLPTYSSWLNLIECQVQALWRFALNETDYASHAEQDRPSTPTCAGTTATRAPPSPGASTPRSTIRPRALRREALALGELPVRIDAQERIEPPWMPPDQ